ncbi:MAG: cell division topological specificity factor MinE [Aquificota bacterium]|nr:MAG: cell division topological specificity factor MinE [Aquificota bacterium]
MGLFDFFKKESSSQVAKRRLQMVLEYERKGLPPNFADLLQNDLKDVFKKYPQFDSHNVEVEIREEDGKEQLWISIPFKG